MQTESLCSSPATFCVGGISSTQLKEKTNKCDIVVTLNFGWKKPVCKSSILTPWSSAFVLELDNPRTALEQHRRLV